MSFQQRAAGLFSLLVVVALTGVCAPFLLGRLHYPEWLTFVGRWIPLLLSLLVMRLVPVPGTVVDHWRLRPGGWRRLLTGVGVGVATVVGVALLPVVLAQAAGLVELKPWSVLAPVLVALPVYVVIGSLSTVGEEVAWRGYLQGLLARHGFWLASVGVSLVWVAVHVPQVGIFVAAGELTGRELAASLVGLFFLGLLLSALVERFGSVWPAVAGHAVPVSSGLLADAAPTGQAAFWAFAALGWGVTLAAAAALRLRP